MDPWQSVGTPLEYWFFRTSWPAGALLVDVIRRGDADQTRVSYHHEGVSGVVRSPGACELTERKSTGEIGRVTWDLAFARGSSAVAGLLRSRLWGLPVPLPPLGYAWVRDGRERYVATPLTGLIRRMPAGDGGLDLRVIAPGGGWSIRAGAPATTFADLGEGIVQSLRADCVLSGPQGRAISRGTATLELRLSGRHRLQPSHQT